MNETFNLDGYLSEGIRILANNILRATLSNPREAAFALRYAAAAKAAERRRARVAAEGGHAPSFLIASIANRCNLSCSGCYARANEGRPDVMRALPLSAARWAELFAEARDLGVSAVLLAGGEPLTRRDVIEAAAAADDLLFPIFTNGTMLGDDYLELFDRRRNLLPLLSIEGSGEETDERRSAGVYAKVSEAMAALKSRGILFGASITVTARNLASVTSSEFFAQLERKGASGAIFVEYVPLSAGTEALALGPEQRESLEAGLAELRSGFPSAIFISFPGDEEASGGCLAAGRGFMHIGYDGAAEPCPFSPHSDTSLAGHSLREALASPLFRKLSSSAMLSMDHSGGCGLVARDREVAAMARS